MKNVIDCDAVFERMTQAPFPTGDCHDTGDWHDDQIELHLQVCHDCRRLAEALRPAVGLFHESLAHDESLPTYNGRLAELQPQDFRNAQATQGMLRTNQWGALLVAGLAACLLTWLGYVGGYRDSGGPGPLQQVSAALPDAHGLSLLVALRLPESCMAQPERTAGPASAVGPASAAGVVLTSMESLPDGTFRCCTQCHRFGGTGPASRAALRALDAACAACHRPPESSTAIYYRLHDPRSMPS